MLQAPINLKKPSGSARSSRLDSSRLEANEEEIKVDDDEMPYKHQLLGGLYSNLETFLRQHSSSLDIDEMNVAESFTVKKKEINVVTPHSS